MRFFSAQSFCSSSRCAGRTESWRAAVPVKEEVGAAALPDTIAPVEAPFDFPLLEKPVFPSLTVSVADYGARRGAMATQAIARAITDVHERGGGRVIVPPRCMAHGAHRAVE